MTLRHGIGWLLTILLAIVFLFTGWGQAVASPSFVSMWSAFGYPHWFMILTGVLEIVAVVLLIAPRTIWYGGILLGVIMFCGLITHLTHGEPSYAPLPIVLGILSVAAAALRTR